MTDAKPATTTDVMRGHNSERALANGVRLELGTIDRKQAGEAVPYARLVPAKWNGTSIVWANPAGKSSLFGDDGEPAGEAAYLVARGNVVIAPDLFMSGENTLPGGTAARPKPENAGYKYAGYVYGYNRSTLANRVQDLLSAVAFARSNAGTKSVQVVATGKTGAVAVLARALAGDAIDRAAINLGGFDFDRVTDPMDEMMLPGGMKYGGINGFAALCTHGQTLLAGGRRDTAAYPRVARTASISLTVDGSGGAEALVDWLEQK
jgi:hypothetical protein